MLHKIETSLYHADLKRIIILSIIFFIGIGINASEAADIEKIPMITHMGFMKSQSHHTPEPPKELILGITITNKAYYKISSNTTIINTGTLNKGLNEIGIDTAKLFNSPGTYAYILETKSGQWNFKYEIILDIRLDTPVPNSKPKPKPPTPGPGELIEPVELTPGKPIRYDLSMYIKGRRVAKIRKMAPRRVIDRTQRKIEKIIEESKKDPRARNADNPAVIHIPSMNLNIVGPIVPLIKPFLKKKRPPPPNNRQLKLSFMKKEKSGTLKKVKAVIRLQSRIIK
ncbi:MAG: hypothetical protein JSV88_01920 [Candidatus Aminicenantes bacterium]|nr:MAG: hypothetical protein JSV88_01920 [Candidatus Aminicenantes bacterium]